jgi:uncharacterized protein
LLAWSRRLRRTAPQPNGLVDHSDNEKFYSSLNHPQGCQLSEWQLTVLGDPANLNTSFDAYLMLRLIVIVGRMVGQAGTLVIVRIGIISDTHGLLLRPKAEQRLAGVEHIVHADDIGRPDIITGLRQIAPVIAIRGNVGTGRWAQSYPDTKMVRLGGRSIYVLHDINELQLDPVSCGVDVVISGHSHRPRIETILGVLYLNPGSAGQSVLTCPSLSRHWS